MGANFNIWRILRVLVVLLPIVFAVSSCGKDAPVEKMSESELQERADEQSGRIKGADGRVQDGCWQDKILTSLYDAMGTMAMGMYDDITKGALAMEMVGFAIWFIFRLMRFVSSITKENSAEVWNEVLRKIFICLFCGILASSTAMLLWVLNYFVFPIYNAFLEFGGEIINLAGGKETVKSIRVLGSEIPVTSPAICLPGAGANEATMEGFPKSPLMMMNCMICSVSERLSLGAYIALKIMMDMNFFQIVNGIILLVTFMIIKLSFVFYLVDNIFKFAVIVVMLPILIMAYPFQKKWTVFGFKTILSSAAFMMGISIMIAVAIMALIEIILQNPTVFDPKNSQDQMKDFSAVMVALLLVSFMIVGTIKVAKEVTSALVDAKVDDNFQKKLMGIALIVAGWLTGGASGLLAKAHWYQKMSAKYNKSWVGKAMKKRANIMSSFNRLAGK